MKTVLTILALCTFAIAASAQITIVKGDYNFSLGNSTTTNYLAQGLLGTSYDIGGTGNGLTWDVSSFTYSKSTINNKFVDPRSTMYAAQFPNATHAIEMIDVDGTSYVYFIINDNGFYIDGLAGLTNGVETILDYSPDQPNMLFPATLGTSWNYNGLPVEVAEGVTQQTRGTYEIDAAGTLILPDGQHDCLRLRSTEWYTTKVEAGGMVVFEGVTKSVDFEFLTKGPISATIHPDTSSPATGNISIESVSYSMLGGATSVDDVMTASDLTLNPAYPNPVQSNGATTLSWTQASQEFVGNRSRNSLPGDYSSRPTKQAVFNRNPFSRYVHCPPFKCGE
jgi:hypothetical protein